MPHSIHLTVAVVCERDGQLLMVEELDNGNRVINQPAGHVEPGEALTSAALRETLEETGLQVQLQSVLGFSCLPAPDGITYYRASFVASCTAASAKKVIDPDILAVHWMSPAEILERDDLRSPLVSMDVHRYLRGRRFPLDMICEDFGDSCSAENN